MQWDCEYFSNTSSFFILLKSFHWETRSCGIEQYYNPYWDQSDWDFLLFLRFHCHSRSSEAEIKLNFSCSSIFSKILRDCNSEHVMKDRGIQIETPLNNNVIYLHAFLSLLQVSCCSDVSVCEYYFYFSIDMKLSN